MQALITWVSVTAALVPVVDNVLLTKQVNYNFDLHRQPMVRTTQKIPTYLLIGDGFDELEAVTVLYRFRQAGLFIKSVSLFGQLVYSRQGVGLKADYRLCDRPFDPLAYTLLILPSGGYNGDMLRHDARIKVMLESLNMGEGFVAVTDSGQNLTNDVRQVVTNRPLFHPYPGQDLNTFVTTLTDCIHFADFNALISQTTFNA